LLAYGRAHGAGEAGGLEPIARDAAAAGADGMIIVDLPPEESDEAVVALRANGLALIYLIAPTSPPERIQAIADRASGFVYLVSVTGVTGARDELPSDLVDFVARVQAMIPLPLAVGFGISNRAQVETIGALCEAAVIGSAVITTIEEAPPDERVSKLRAFGTSITAG
ncbi:MAG TPA: tryptophan synthase subunit alpha, partial [Dehalococcoidia bacterium]|nr:tryptophan synthase subunit alpha [Dehalococcoidia bacterium]